jgi:hypothetical protein
LFFALAREFSFSGEVTNNKKKKRDTHDRADSVKKEKEESPNSRRE